MTGWITAAALLVLLGILWVDNRRLEHRITKLVGVLQRERALRRHYQDLARNISPIRRIK